MDIDLVRVTAAAFCSWVARDLLDRPRWGPGDCGGGKAGTISNLAGSVQK